MAHAAAHPLRLPSLAGVPLKVYDQRDVRRAAGLALGLLSCGVGDLRLWREGMAELDWAQLSVKQWARQRTGPLRVLETEVQVLDDSRFYEDDEPNRLHGGLAHNRMMGCGCLEGVEHLERTAPGLGRAVLEGLGLLCRAVWVVTPEEALEYCRRTQWEAEEDEAWVEENHYEGHYNGIRRAHFDRDVPKWMAQSGLSIDWKTLRQQLMSVTDPDVRVCLDCIEEIHVLGERPELGELRCVPDELSEDPWLPASFLYYRRNTVLDEIFDMHAHDYDNGACYIYNYDELRLDDLATFAKWKRDAEYVFDCWRVVDRLLAKLQEMTERMPHA